MMQFLVMNAVQTLRYEGKAGEKESLRSQIWGRHGGGIELRVVRRQDCSVKLIDL